MLAHFHHSFLPTLVFFSLVVNAVLVNITVDDARPSINYLPGNSWAAQPGCNACSAEADTNQVFSGTWHDSSYFPPDQNNPDTVSVTATFSFTGSAIYVFCVLWFGDQPNNFSNMTFFIDGELVGNFINPIMPGAWQRFSYNVMVYANTSLSPGNHQFVLQNGGGESRSLVLFDYLIYSHGDDTADTMALATEKPTSIPGSPSPASQSSDKSPPVEFQTVVTAFESTLTTFQVPPSPFQSVSTILQSSTIVFQSPAAAPATFQSTSTTSDSETPVTTKSSMSGLVASPSNISSERSDRLSKVGVTVGSIVGSVCVIALAILIFVFLIRRRRQARRGLSLVPFQASQLEGNNSASSNASTAQLLVLFNSTPSPKLRPNVRERDAGPLNVADLVSQGGALPPEYGQVFTQSSETRPET